MTQVWTVGHSTRSTQEFIALLTENGIRLAADIRSLPGSRRNPQFGREALARALEEAGIAYVHLKALGGLRPKAARSRNTAWRNASFRNYADYMQTPAFEEGLEALTRLARETPTAILCAEAVPWRCHRSLVGDALLARGVAVWDILGKGKTVPHSMTPFAKVLDGRVSYPGPDEELSAGEPGGEDSPPPARPGEGASPHV